MKRADRCDSLLILIFLHARMFFSQDLLARHAKSGLGVVWLAATLGDPSAAAATAKSKRHLSRRDYARVDVAGAWCARFGPY